MIESMQKKAETLDEFIKLSIEEEYEATLFGYHTIAKFIENPWEWYLRYMVGIEPAEEKSYFVLGKAVHLAKEAFYLYDGSLATLEKTFNAFMEAKKLNYLDGDLYFKDHQKGLQSLRVWHTTFGEKDIALYDVLGAEYPMNFKLANGLEMTTRMDLLLRRKNDGHVLILDTKTTGYQADAAHMDVELGDQATTYLLALRKNHPDELVDGLLPDIHYWRWASNMKAPSLSCERFSFVGRSDYELWAWEMCLISAWQSLVARIQAVKNGMPPEYAFIRNSAAKAKFAKQNPYIDFYKSPVDPKYLPGNFIIESKEETIIQPLLAAWNATFDNFDPLESFGKTYGKS